MTPFGDVYGLDPRGLVTSDQLAALGDVGTFTVATLPAAGTWSRRTAWVTDLFSDQPTPGGRVVSEGGFWKPIRPLATASVVVGGNLTLTPLLHSPTQILTGSIAAGLSRAVGYSTVNAYPGARFRSVNRMSLGLAAVLNVVGAVVPLGSWVDHEYDPVTNTWVQTASGGLL